MPMTASASAEEATSPKERLVKAADELVRFMPPVLIAIVAASFVTWGRLALCLRPGFTRFLTLGILLTILIWMLYAKILCRFPRYRSNEDARSTFREQVEATLTVIAFAAIPGALAGAAFWTSDFTRTFTAYSDGRHVVVMPNAGSSTDGPFAKRIKYVGGALGGGDPYYLDDAGTLTPLKRVAQKTAVHTLGDGDASDDIARAFAQQVEKESVPARASVAPADVEKAGNN